MQTLYQSLVAVEPATLIVTILNLFLQLFIIKKFFLNKILDVLDKRRSAADQEISEAKNAKQEALAIKETYENNMKQTQLQADQILDNAKKTAVMRSEEIIRDAQSQAVHIKQKAAQDIAQEKKKAINDAKDEISGMAMAIAEKVVGRELNAQDQSELVDHFIRELGEQA